MKKLLTSLTAFAAFVLFFAVTATPAHAVLSNNPDNTWGANGKVRVIHRFGNVIYIGGDFTQLVNPVNGQTMNRNRLAAIDATTGVPTAWNPNVNNSVYTIETSSAGGTVFFGGSFTTVGGQTRNRIAAVNASDGLLVTSFNPNANGVVRAIERTASALYIGGNFTTMSGQTRTRLARVNTTGSLNTGWIASADVTVSSIAIPADGSRIIVAGSFNTINGVSEPRVASLNPTTGASNGWASNPSNVVYDLAVSGTTVYVAQAGTNVLSAHNLTTGAQTWTRSSDGDFQAVEYDPVANRVIAGGHYQTINGQTIPRLTWLDVNGNVVSTWVPRPNSGSGTEVLGVWAIATSGNKIYAGGDFTLMNSTVNQPKFAQWTDQ